MALQEKEFAKDTIKGLALDELQGAVEVLQAGGTFFIPFGGDNALAPGAGGSAPPSAFKGEYMNWGFSQGNPDSGQTFALAAAVTKLTLSAYPNANSLTASSGKLQVFRTIGAAVMSSSGVLIAGAELTWGPGDATEKRLDLTGLALNRGDSIAIFHGVTNDGGTGTFDFLRGGLLFG